MTAATITDRSALASALRELKLSGMLATLDARLAQANAGELGHLDFLQVLCQDEISRRQSMSLQRRIRRARFEHEAPSKASTSAPPRNCPPPRSATWPPCAGCKPGNRSSSTGPSGSARATSPRPWPTSRSAPAPTPGSPKPAGSWPAWPAGAPTAPGTSGSPNWSGPPCSSWTDFAMRELTASQADDLYELITERAGKSLILTSNRGPADWYPLSPNPVVAESLLDRLINTSHQVFMNGPSYRPNQRPGRVVPRGTRTSN